MNVFNKPIRDKLATYSFGVYIYHYMFNSWLQLSLFTINMSGFIKGLIVFILTLLCSLGTAILVEYSLRRFK
jgi:peptidoglycan/LPS O-acetylase OafA/YrhL